MNIRRTLVTIVPIGLALTLYCLMVDPKGNTPLEAQQPAQVTIDDSDVQAIYANQCRMIGTPEEVILEFALNPQSFGEAEVPIHVERRVVMNFFTAKRTLYALTLTVARHEATFGRLEVDPGKRLKLGGTAKVATKSADEASDRPSTPSQQSSVRTEKHSGSLPPSYANFCRVTGTPEEMILDLGLNPQPFGVPTKPIPVQLRIITSFFTAKRMMQALQSTIQRHEKAFGVLETDVQRRVKPGVLPVLREPDF